MHLAQHIGKDAYTLSAYCATTLNIFTIAVVRSLEQLVANPGDIVYA